MFPGTLLCFFLHLLVCFCIILQSIVQGASKLFGRVVKSELVGRFAIGHNEGLWECLNRNKKLEGGVSDTVKNITSALGGLGLRSAIRTSESAFWASWADRLAMLREQHPTVTASIVASLEWGGT